MRPGLLQPHLGASAASCNESIAPRAGIMPTSVMSTLPLRGCTSCAEPPDKHSMSSTGNFLSNLCAHWYFSAWWREKALAEEKDHVFTVLAEWQHYGRTRNTDFENALKAAQQKDQEIKALKQQVNTTMNTSIGCPAGLRLRSQIGFVVPWPCCQFLAANQSLLGRADCLTLRLARDDGANAVPAGPAG